MDREDVIRRSKFFFLLCIFLFIIFWTAISLPTTKDFIMKAVMSSVVLSYNLLLYLIFLLEILNRYPILEETAKKRIKPGLFILQISSIILSLISFYSDTVAYISSTISLVLYISISSLIEKNLGYIFTVFIAFILYKSYIQIPYYLLSLFILYLPSIFPFLSRKRDEALLYTLSILSIISIFFESYPLALVLLSISVITFLRNIPHLTPSYKIVGITIIYSIFLVFLSLIGMLFEFVTFYSFFTASLLSSLIISSHNFLFLLARRGVFRYEYKPERIFLPIFIMLLLCTFIGSSLFFGEKLLYIISSISLSIFLIPYLSIFWQVYRGSIKGL